MLNTVSVYSHDNQQLYITKIVGDDIRLQNAIILIIYQFSQNVCLNFTLDEYCLEQYYLNVCQKLDSYRWLLWIFGGKKTDVDKNITIPAGPLGIIALESSKPLAQKVDSYLVKWRAEREHKHSNEIAFHEDSRDSYLLKAYTPRFGSGEGKGLIKESVRGDDLYILVDVTNHSIKYSVSGFENRMSPDDHYQDSKRITAVGGKAKRITVIMPFLYESRQHRRHSRESLDCALALQELVNMGVESIITSMLMIQEFRMQSRYIPLNQFNVLTNLLKHLLAVHQILD